MIFSKEEERKKDDNFQEIYRSAAQIPLWRIERQHFQIPDENYMSTFQFADFAPDKIQFQITSEISQGL